MFLTTPSSLLSSLLLSSLSPLLPLLSVSFSSPLLCSPLLILQEGDFGGEKDFKYEHDTYWQSEIEEWKKIFGKQDREEGREKRERGRDGCREERSKQRKISSTVMVLDASAR